MEIVLFILKRKSASILLIYINKDKNKVERENWSDRMS